MQHHLLVYRLARIVNSGRLRALDVCIHCRGQNHCHKSGTIAWFGPLVRGIVSPASALARRVRQLDGYTSSNGVVAIIGISRPWYCLIDALPQQGMRQLARRTLSTIVFSSSSGAHGRYLLAVIWGSLFQEAC